MSIASRIRLRRALARAVPSLGWGRSSSDAAPVQHYVILVWFGCVVQVAVARPKGLI